jgi:hypothetical protein
VMLSRLPAKDLLVVGCIAAASLTRGSNAHALPAGVLALVITDAVRRTYLAVLVRSHSDPSLSVAVMVSTHVSRLARLFRFSESVARL